MIITGRLREDDMYSLEVRLRTLRGRTRVGKKTQKNTRGVITHRISKRIGSDPKWRGPTEGDRYGVGSRHPQVGRGEGYPKSMKYDSARPEQGLVHTEQGVKT